MDLHPGVFAHIAACGDLHICRNPNADSLWAIGEALGALTGPPSRVVGDLGCSGERVGVTPRVIDLPAMSPKWKLVVSNKVADPKLNRIDVELPSGHVHDAFNEGCGLWATGPAVGPHRGGGGHCNRDITADHRDVVVALSHPFGTGRQHGPHRWVGPRITHDADPKTGNQAVVIAAKFHILDLSPAVRQSFHIL